MYPRYFKIKPGIFDKKGSCLQMSASTESCSSSESDSSELVDVYEERPSFEHSDYPDHYWRFQKTVKYLNFGRPFITSLTFMLCTDFDFKDPAMLDGLERHKVIEILLNVLPSHDKRVQMTSLKFLNKLSSIKQIRQKIVYLGGIEAIVSLLKEPQMDVRMEAAKAITSAAVFHKALTAVRLSGGIPLLVNLIYLSKKLLNQPHETLSNQLKSIISTAEVAAETLLVVCKCRKNQLEFVLSGALLGCQKILQSSHAKLTAAIMQLVHRCSSQKLLRLAVRHLGMLNDFHIHFYSEDQELMLEAAQATYMCAEGEESKRFFRKPGFADKLYEIIQRSAYHSQDNFMIAISGALWKCAEHEANVQRLKTLNAAPFLIQLLGTQSFRVQEHIMACLTCCMKDPEMRTVVKNNKGVETFIGLLQTVHPPLIMQLNKALAIASRDDECLALMQKYNALQLIWSHLKNEDPSVVSNTAWQLTAILENTESSAEYIRNLSGGMKLLTELLSSQNTRVLTPICALIVILSKEEENLIILTDYQVVAHLSNLTNTVCRRLRYHLCMAIAACCPCRRNRQDFARRKIVFPLLKMLKSHTPAVAGAATHALGELCWIPSWCAVMYNSPGVYQILTKQMRQNDRSVQERAADIIQKMRLFALNRDGNVPRWLLERHRAFVSKQPK